MRITRLKLAGFKSFVDPTELVIEAGLTGVVGPNGCGKSNLVEALRWVMGENSARQLRGGEMDDVIFGGSATRPARNMAEVALLLETAPGHGPTAVNDDEVEVIRRIERGSGSVYRLNGREARARDIQVLFADAASGARSASLVSQGQVGALITAKPAERRHILEEAAGIAGLHSRRREAELRLQAAEANLERLDDLLATYETQRQGLKRQARQAARYRELNARIRRTEAMLLARRWTDVEEAAEAAESALAEAAGEVRARTEANVRASRLQAEAAALLPQSRADVAAADGELQRLAAARKTLDSEAEQVAARLQQTEVRLAQIDADIVRERALSAEAAEALAALEKERAEIFAASADEEEVEKAAGEALSADRSRVSALEERVTAATDALADAKARRRTLEERLDAIAQRLDRLAKRAAAAASEREDLAANAADAALAESEEALARAEAEAEQRRSDAAAHGDAVEKAEAARNDAEARAREAGKRLQGLKEAQARLSAEAEALAALLADGRTGGNPIMDSIAVEPGFETALAAALGSDLEASEGGDEGTYWRVLPDLDEAPSVHVTVPLSRHVRAPAALARRLTRTGLVDPREALALQAKLAPGERLVSRDGGLWRWDGLVVAPGTPSTAAVRLGQRNRLEEARGGVAELQSETDQAQSEDTAAGAAAAAAIEAHRQAIEAGKQAEAEARTAERRLADARDRRARALAACERHAVRRTSLDDEIERLGREREEAIEEQAATRAALAELPSLDHEQGTLADLRTALAAARAAQADCQSRYDQVKRAAGERRARLEAIKGEIEAWHRRRNEAEAKLDDLAARRRDAARERELLAERPRAIEAERSALHDRLTRQEAARREAADRLAEAEARLSACDRDVRETGTALSAAREAEIRAEARVEQARERRSALGREIADRFSCAPDSLLSTAGIGDDEPVPNPEALGDRLQRLQSDRERLGPVNLRAEAEIRVLDDQIATLEAERADLVSAVARLRGGIGAINREARDRLTDAFNAVNAHFGDLFRRLFGGGEAHIAIVDSDDPLAAGLEVMASPPGKRLQVLSLLSGGEQALTALALMFAVFLTQPSPICVLDEVDAPLDDANVDRFCSLIEELAHTLETRFLVVTHHRLTMARMDRLFGVTMVERGVSRLVSVDLRRAVAMRAAE